MLVILYLANKVFIPLSRFCLYRIFNSL